VLPKFKPSSTGAASDFIEVVLIDGADTETDLFGVAAAAFRFRLEDLLGNRYLFEDFLLILGVDFEKKSAIPSLVLSFHEKYASSEIASAK
jgi:hypothetical protein